MSLSVVHLAISVKIGPPIANKSVSDIVNLSEGSSGSGSMLALVVVSLGVVVAVLEGVVALGVVVAVLEGVVALGVVVEALVEAALVALGVVALGVAALVE